VPRCGDAKRTRSAGEMWRLVAVRESAVQKWSWLTTYQKSWSSNDAASELSSSGTWTSPIESTVPTTS